MTGREMTGRRMNREQEEKEQVSTKNKKIIEKIRVELIHTTDTLWNNEVASNLFVARILIYTAVIAALILVLSVFHVFTISNSVMVPNMSVVIAVLLIAAGISIRLKGERTWLKTMLLVVYVLVLSTLHMSLGHNIVLCLVFPVVLSVRYYSRALTAFISGLTIVTYLIASYLGITHQLMRMDMNMVKVPGGTVLTSSAPFFLRDALDPSILDYHQMFLHFLQHSFLPKVVLFSMIAMICTLIAQRGRRAIFEQKAETEKAERIATELNLASEIQSNVLPNLFPVFPERKEISLYASMTPAKEVGGDFYDFFFVDDRHLAMVMADVSGKGVPAALFMMVARTLIKNRAMMGGSPSEILFDVNNQLCEGNAAELFVTVWLGILDITTGKGMAANAGHEHPVIRSANDEYKLVIYRHSPAVGAMEGMRFREHEFELKPGDSLFIYTDGVAEATNADNELFGSDRMLKALNKEPDAMPEQLLANVRDGIQEFVQGAEQFDDITMMSLKYFGDT